jgi:hypothetical protein
MEKKEYEFQAYPSWRYHRDGRAVMIHGDEHHQALDAEGWRDTPAAFLTVDEDEQGALSRTRAWLASSPEKNADVAAPAVNASDTPDTGDEVATDAPEEAPAAEHDLAKEARAKTTKRK